MLILPRNDKPANGMFIELCNLGIEIFSCLLLQRMARMDMDWKLKQLKPTFLSFDALPTKIAKKYYG